MVTAILLTTGGSVAAGWSVSPAASASEVLCLGSSGTIETCPDGATPAPTSARTPAGGAALPPTTRISSSGIALQSPLAIASLTLVALSILLLGVAQRVLRTNRRSAIRSGRAATP